MHLEQQYEKLILVDWRKEFPNEEIPREAVNFWAVAQNYENVAGEKYFAELARIVLNAHALPVSNAFVKRIFSHVFEVTEKMLSMFNSSIYKSSTEHPEEHPQLQQLSVS